MAKVHNDLLVNHNQIHSAIGNDELAKARELLCCSIRMIDSALGGRTAIAHPKPKRAEPAKAETTPSDTRPVTQFDGGDLLADLQPKKDKGKGKKKGKGKGKGKKG